MNGLPAARKIMIIRHGEKPDENGNPPGYTWEGDPDKRSLTSRGWNRAHNLVALFTQRATKESGLATPDWLFATGVGPESKSRRPGQTIIPLALKLGMDINANYYKGWPGLKQMVKHALSCRGVVLISWVHEEIPEIANRILGDDTTAPQHWSGRRYDIVWVFDRAKNEATFRFSQVPQLVISGDMNTVIEG